MRKYIFIAGLAMLFLFTACGENEYTPSPPTLYNEAEYTPPTEIEPEPEPYVYTPGVYEYTPWVDLGVISVPATWSYNKNDFGDSPFFALDLFGEGAAGEPIHMAVWGVTVGDPNMIINEFETQRAFAFDDGRTGHMLKGHLFVTGTMIIWLQADDIALALSLYYDGDETVFTNNEELILQIAKTLTAPVTYDYTGIGVTFMAETWQEAFAKTLRYFASLQLRDWVDSWEFILHDINQDGIPELFIIERHMTGHLYYRYIYAFVDGAAVPLEFTGFLTDGAVYAPIDNSPWVVAFLAVGSGGRYVKLEMVGNEIVTVVEGMALMSAAGHDMMYADEDFDWQSYEWYDVTINGHEVTAEEFESVFGLWGERVWLGWHEVNKENINEIIFALP